MISQTLGILGESDFKVRNVPNHSELYKTVLAFDFLFTLGFLFEDTENLTLQLDAVGTVELQLTDSQLWLIFIIWVFTYSVH